MAMASLTRTLTKGLSLTSSSSVVTKIDSSCFIRVSEMLEEDDNLKQLLLFEETEGT